MSASGVPSEKPAGEVSKTAPDSTASAAPVAASSAGSVGTAPASVDTVPPAAATAQRGALSSSQTGGEDPSSGPVPRAPPTDQAIRAKLQEVLRGADLEALTAREVRSKLEAEFGVSLNDRKAFINQELTALLEAEAEKQAAPGSAAAAAPTPTPAAGGKRKAAEDVSATSTAKPKAKATASPVASAPKKTKVAPRKAVAKREHGSEDGSDDSDGVSEGAAAAAAAASAGTASDAAASSTPKKGRQSKPKTVLLRETLREFFGKDEMMRGDIVKGIHDYAKEHGLKEGQYINCDEKLQKAFKKKRLHIFKMAKDIEKLILDRRFL